MTLAPDLQGAAGVIAHLAAAILVQAQARLEGQSVVKAGLLA